MPKYFSTLLPPPNLTGTLHLGHMWNAILQDVLIRYYQSQNIPTYWGFGLDHAGLSLQIRVESELKKRGIEKSDLSEKEFWTYLWDWKNKHETLILDEYSKLSLSLPYHEQRFTLDENSKQTVLWAFEKLYKKGLIYRAERLVNWDTVMKTAISDIEVIYKQEEVNMYKLKYFFVNSNKDYLEVCTTRIETIFGDIALFVNPEDERYSHYIGKKVYVPFIKREIPIISDSYIDKDFGTGIMKCTPAHDFNDWKLGKKYNLEVIRAFNEEGIMSCYAWEFEGMQIEDCRKKIVEILLNKGFLTIEKYLTNISYSERSASKIEPTLSTQWFLKSSLLAKKALKYLKNNQDSLIFFPTKASEWIYKHLENTEDWCISRQLLWGIRIPLWINNDTGEHSFDKPISSDGWYQSEDVLDTWFSSSLWPLIVFRQISEIEGNENSVNSSFFPISLLISGKDILFFWISRMIYFSIYFLDTVPFKQVYLHGLLLDLQNRKMSKSLGNGVLPHELIDRCGLDASRLFLLLNTNFDKNLSFSWEKSEYAKKFLHKLNNLCIFLKSYKSQLNKVDFNFSDLNWYEKWLLNKFLNLKQNIKKDFKELKFSSSTKKILDFLWSDFCNYYIEFFKLQKKQGFTNTNISFTFYIWKDILKLLYPLIPTFSTEKYLEFYNQEISFESSKDLYFEQEKTEYNWFFNYLYSIRNMYTELKINPQTKFNLRIVIPENYREIFINKYSELFPFFEMINQQISEISTEKSLNKGISLLIDNILFELSTDNAIMINYLDQIEKIKKSKRKEIERAMKFLANKDFCKKAPNYLIKQEEDKLKKYKEELEFYENI